MAPSAALLVLSAAAALASLAEAADVPIKVVGLGVGRTGTQTLRQALEVLGYKVFGDAEIVWKQDVRQMILKAKTSQDWAPFRQYIVENGYNATVGLDDLQFDVWKAFNGTENGIKGVLTVRPFESWYKSIFRHQFWEVRYMMHRHGAHRWFEYCPGQDPSFISNFLVTPLLRTEVCPSYCVYWHRPSAAARCRFGFEKKNADRRKLVHESQRLDYDVKEGWEPLCKFLGIPKPAASFPRYDGSTLELPDFKRWKTYFYFELAGLVFLHFILPLLLLGLACRRCCRGSRRQAGAKDD